MKKRITLISVLLIATLLICLFSACGLTDATNGDSGTNDVESAKETVYPMEISLASAATVAVGDTTALTVSYVPDTTNTLSCTWATSDAAVASVDAGTGLITGIKAGQATISVTVRGETGTLTASCLLTVEENAVSGIAPTDQTGEFTIATEDGTYEKNENVYTITAAGEYVLSGYLEGEIVVDAGDDDEVKLVLAGVTVKYAQNSPILIKNADSVTVKAEKGTENTVYDERATKTTDVDEQGEGAISAKCDLKLAGTGTLYVEGNYNNGVHTTKDLKVQKLTLKVVAYNNAMKGKDSVTIVSGTLAVISTNGDGIETSDSDVSSKGNQRGTIAIGETDGKETPAVTVYAAGDGVQSAYDFVMNAGTLTVYNGSYSSYTAKNASVDSYKGVKVKNELVINGGSVTLRTYDDGLHADYGAALENGETGKGNITINDGTVNISVTSSSSRYVSGADAIHADNTLTVNGGVVTVASAYEGLEATYIKINGGTITVSASDDGRNAAKKIANDPSIVVTGGTVDITMASGDTDGIDSNGTFTMTGGLVISRGASGSNGMATGLDCDGTATISGGTFIQLGGRETVPTLKGCYTLNYGAQSGGMGGGSFNPGGMGGMGGRGGMRFAVNDTANNASSSNYSFTAGTWTIEGLNVSFTVATGYNYGGCVVYSSLLTQGATYTLSNGSATYTATAA